MSEESCLSGGPANIDPATLLRDECFLNLLKDFSDHGIPKEKFLSMPMPVGFSAAMTWEFVMQIRRAQAIYYHDTCMVDGKPVRQWYTLTRKIDRLLRELSTRTQRGSELDRALSERSGRRFIVKPLIEEVVASLSCDGMDIDYESARSVIVGERGASGAAEQLASNMHTLLIDLKDKEPREFTPMLVADIYDTLLEGVDASSLKPNMLWEDNYPEDPLDGSIALDELCSMANGSLIDTAAHPIIAAQRLVCKSWKALPFQHCNCMMGSLLSRICLNQSGYPVFMYIPLSSMVLAWMRGGYSDDEVHPYAQSGNICEIDRDWTVDWETCLELAARELSSLERHVQAMKRSDDELLDRLRCGKMFNHRQIEVLSRALLVPETIFCIGSHKEEFDLAYSTARADLSGLMERGLFDMRYEAKAQVYTARFDMKQALAKLVPLFRECENGTHADAVFREEFSIA